MNTKDEVLDLIAKTLEITKEEVVEDKKLYESIGVDSTEMVELTIAIGKQFGIKIETNEITKFSTPNEIAGVIEAKKQ